MKKILVVDDNPDTAKVLKLMFQKEGYQSSVAFDAATGKTIFLKENPDLLILDISMPGGSGFDIAKFANTNVKCNPLIIFLSARSDDESKAIAKQYNAYGFIEKPVDLTAILAVVKEALHE